MKEGVYTKSRIMSIAVCLLMITSISTPFTQNVGQSQNLMQSGPRPTSVGSGGLADSPWPMFQQNLRHTSVSPYDTSGNQGNLKWSFTTGSYVTSSPAIGSDGTIYIGSDDYKLYAINPNGTEKWSFTTGRFIRSSPAIGSDGTIYIGSYDNNIYAVNPDGTQKWCFTTQFWVSSSPAISSTGTIYVGSSDYNFYAINPDGTQQWKFPTGYYATSSPAIGYDGTIYLGTYNQPKGLCAINPDGTLKWHFANMGEVYGSSPVIKSDGTIYIGSEDNKLHAINPDGTEKWNFTTGGDVRSSPAIGSEGTIYVGSFDNKLYAINPDGTEKWSFTTGARICSAPAIGSDGAIYFGSDDNKFYALNPDGTEKWRFTTGYGIWSSPAIGSDGTIYIGSQDHILYAIGGAAQNQSPVADAGPDQTVYEGDIVVFDGSASSDPDGTIVSYQWDFDASDGLWWETSAAPDATDPSPIHVYGDDGVYTATLRVTDDVGEMDTDTCAVSVNNVAPAVPLSNTLLDTMDSGWTITATSCGSAIVSGGYSSAQYTSPPTSIRAYLANGGTDGKDCGKILADKDFNFNRLDRLKIRYYIAHQTDVNDAWGGMAARAEVRFITHDASGDHTYRYIVAASETTRGNYDANHYCDAQPGALYVDETNTVIPAPGDAELEPPTGAWYILDRDVNNDFAVDWYTVSYITVEIAHYGGWMYLDAFETYFDDLELTCGMISVDEGSSMTVTVNASDPGSDDLTFTWNWGDGSPDTVTTYYNDGTGLEPVYDPITNEIKSPWGIYPFNVTGTAVHIYSDDGIYNITLTVEDDEGGTTTTTISVTVNNAAPTIVSTMTPAGNEGSSITFTSTAIDPGSDDLTFTWDWGDGTSSISTTHYNNGMGPDPYPSPLGIFPFTVTDTVTHTYGDNGVYTITLTIEDDDAGVKITTSNVTVYNVAPTITLIIAPSGDEGEEMTFTAEATDLGSDDLSFTIEFEHGPTITNTYYNDGMNPDPPQSPWGDYPFTSSDTVTHVYGDDYNYTLLLTVNDDDGGISTYTTTVAIDNVAPSIIQFAIPIWIGEEASATYLATAEDHGSDDLTFEWSWDDGTPVDSHTHYNNGLSPDPYPSPAGTFLYTATETVNHTYGDNYNYSLTLKVTDDDGGVTTFTTTIVIHNIVPTIESFGPFAVDEGSPLVIIANSTDPGSDDLTFTWEFELGPTFSNVHYNDGASPDPYPSPWGTFPFSVSDVITHSYGDNGVYNVTLTVEDDDGGTTTHITTIKVNNVAPTIEPFGPFMVDEGSPLDLTAISTDPGSDDMEFTWEFDMGPTVTNAYYNDGLRADPYPSPWGLFPCSASDSVENTYGDDGIFPVTLTVTDDDGGTASYITNIRVNNVAPTIVSMEASMFVNLTLRVAGEKYHSVGIQLFEDGSEIWVAKVTRYPGSPDEQAATITGLRIDLSKIYTAKVDYLPNDPRVNGNVWGGNPVWIDITFENGSIKRLHHTFNMRQSYWDSDHWNHIGPWEVELKSNLVGGAFKITSHITDPGSDDIHLTYTYGSQIVNVTYLNNPSNPDPYPSPEINPVNIMDTTTLIYEGPGTVTLIVKDDDNIRLGIGEGSDSFSIA